MSRPAASKCLKTDTRRLEHVPWSRWLRFVAKTRAEFARTIDYDPMSNERASVGVLATAAARAGMLALTEYLCPKRQADHRKRLRHGRIDLWVGSPGSRSWAFEAKQLRCRPGTRASSIEAALERACHDASALPTYEANRFFGVLVATPPDEGSHPALLARLRKFAQEADFAWECAGSDRPAFVYFRVARRSK